MRVKEFDDAVVVSVKMDTRLRDRLQDVADRDTCSLSSVIRRACIYYIWETPESTSDSEAGDGQQEDAE